MGEKGGRLCLAPFSFTQKTGLGNTLHITYDIFHLNTWNMDGEKERLSPFTLHTFTMYTK